MSSTERDARLIELRVGIGVLDGVADRIADDGFGMIGQRGIDDRKRAHELHAGRYFGTRKLGDLPRPAVAAVASFRRGPGRASPTAKSRWMMWSWRSRAIRSRSVRTSSSRIRRCALASCQASAAWSAKAAIMSSQRCNLFCQWSSPVGGRLAVNR